MHADRVVDPAVLRDGYDYRAVPLVVAGEAPGDHRALPGFESHSGRIGRERLELRVHPRGSIATRALAKKTRGVDNLRDAERTELGDGLGSGGRFLTVTTGRRTRRRGFRRSLLRSLLLRGPIDPHAQPLVLRGVLRGDEVGAVRVTVRVVRAVKRRESVPQELESEAGLGLATAGG